MNQTHLLKCWPKYFRAVKQSEKTFEIRKNDRGYRVGDILILKEYIPEKDWIEQYEGNGFTGNSIIRKVTYVTDFMQQPGYVVLGLSS